jgi:hypothetical protein
MSYYFYPDRGAAGIPTPFAHPKSSRRAKLHTLSTEKWKHKPSPQPTDPAQTFWVNLKGKTGRSHPSPQPTDPVRAFWAYLRDKTGCSHPSTHATHPNPDSTHPKRGWVCRSEWVCRALCRPKTADKFSRGAYNARPRARGRHSGIGKSCQRGTQSTLGHLCRHKSCS